VSLLQEQEFLLLESLLSILQLELEFPLLVQVFLQLEQEFPLLVLLQLEQVGLRWENIDK